MDQQQILNATRLSEEIGKTVEAANLSAVEVVAALIGVAVGVSVLSDWSLGDLVNMVTNAYAETKAMRDKLRRSQ